MGRTARTAVLFLFVILPPALGRTAEEDAKALLAAAIDRQGPRELAEPGAIEDLTVRIQAEVYDHSKAPPEKTSLGVDRYLSLDPERFRSEWRTSAGTQVSGYDGRFFWYAEYTRAGTLADREGNPIFYRGDQYAEDRRRIMDEIAETRYLLRLFFLANLTGEHIEFTRRPDETMEAFGRKHETVVLHRENRAPDSTEPPLTLWLDAKDETLLRARVHATEKGQRSLIFSFRYDERVQPRVKGVLFPFRIETREQPFGAEESRLASTATVLEDGKGIDFNTDLDPAIFKRPK